MPLLIAVLAAISIVGAQLINAWRESQRREQDIRHDHLHWEYEDRARWSQQRLELYARYLALIDKCTRSVGLAMAQFELRRDLDLKKPIAILADCVDTLAAIKIVGSSPVVKAGQEAHDCLNDMVYDLIAAKPLDPSDRAERDMSDRMSLVKNRVRNVQEAMRGDLGTTGRGAKARSRAADPHRTHDQTGRTEWASPTV
ncbi:hypothetical protein F0L68_02155 [Solihabitans fulvus]|uniref:Uncharacterized protein n=1 Tax=Solihabitans fulvus TaxID=1892852 RepID=A0A5B2XUF0_9PSEU|nr:hypothetical protein [Solihabitans fulvus]KAA2266562.1 hypothetical protein F0L68_02155 [Solihabitans fulvus]